MSIADRMESALGSPAALEALYRAAVAAGDAPAFAAELARRHALAPSDPLLAAWFERLRPGDEVAAPTESPLDPADDQVPDERPARRRQWKLALLLSVGLSIVYSIMGGSHDPPMRLMFAWGPAAAVALMAFLHLGLSRPVAATVASSPPSAWGRALPAFLVLIAITIAAFLGTAGGTEPDGMDLLMLIHLPALAWLALGWSILGNRAAASESFAGVHKSIEAVVTAGLLAGTGVVFAMMTFALFAAISIDLPDIVKRFLMCGGPGFIPVLAVATVYDPDRSPLAQHSGHGIGSVIFTAGRLFLPVTLLVLVVYVFAIPFKFWEPFHDRDVLIVYNTLLFAVMVLIVTATPLRPGSLASRHEKLLRRGIVAVASLTLLVSLYAMAAVLYRAAQGGLTMNRLTVIGWNTVNIATLALLVFRQARDGPADWVAGCHRTFRVGLVGYAAWTLFVLVGIPLLWRNRS